MNELNKIWYMHAVEYLFRLYKRCSYSVDHDSVDDVLLRIFITQSSLCYILITFLIECFGF